MARRAVGTPTANCSRCARRVSPLVTQRIREDALRWTVSCQCTHCGHVNDSDGSGLPTARMHRALMQNGYASVQLTPPTFPKGIAARRIGPLLQCDDNDAEGIVRDMFGSGFVCTNVEADFLRSALRSPFHFVITEHEGTPPIPEGHSFPAGPIEDFERLWTTDRTRWVLARVWGGGGFIALEHERNGALIIENHDTSVEVLSRMAEAGVPIVDVELGDAGGAEPDIDRAPRRR